MLRKHWLSGEIYLPEPEITSFLDFFLKHWHLSSRILPFPLSPLSRKHTRACLLRMQQNLADTRSWSFYSFCFYTQKKERKKINQRCCKYIYIYIYFLPFPEHSALLLLLFLKNDLRLMCQPGFHISLH